MDTTSIVQIIIWLLLGFWGWHIGKEKNRPALGAIMGFLLGFIGIIILIFVKPKVLPVSTPPELPKDQ